MYFTLNQHFYLNIKIEIFQYLKLNNLVTLVKYIYHIFAT